MAIYKYRARDKFGRATKGTMSAEEEGAVYTKLREMGYIPVSISQKQENEQSSFNLAFLRQIRFSDINMFTRQFATLQRAGITMTVSLTALKEQATNKALKDIIEQMRRDIEGGLSLSEAMDKHNKVFNSIYLSMIRAGETSGRLDEILERLATLGEHDELVRMRIKGAMRYPIMVVVAIVIGFLILTTLVVPRFAQVYGQFKVALPLPTQILIWMNIAITKFWWLLIIISVLIVFLSKRFINTKVGRVWLDGLVLKAPVFGPLLIKMIMSRFARITGTLMHSGVPILQILELVSSGAGNLIVSRAIDNIKLSVNEGRGMVEPMKVSGLFPPVVTQMVSVGEDTGRLEELLLHVSEYYDAQIDYTLNNLVSLIEPILIFFLGLVVLFMALGIFLPMWNLMSLFRR